ncbi:MAG: sulfur carrier protein ThiS [Pyrinomonadaceae bacterium]
MSEIQIFLNGEKRSVPTPIDLDRLLEHFSLPKQRIAIELNNMVVRRVDWPQTAVSEADRIEVVHFVGGG